MATKKERPIPDLTDSTLCHWKDYLYVDSATGMVLARVGCFTSLNYEKVAFRGKETYAHRIVWEACFGAIPEGLTINHLDCDPTNNHPDNLELATQAEQVAYTIKLGRKGSNNRRPGPTRRTKLSAADVQRLREAPYGSVVGIAEELGISKKYAHRISGGRVNPWTL